MQTWVANLVFKFHDDLTVNKFGIVVLLEQVWVYMGKRKLWCEGHFSHLRHYFANSNGENVWKWVLNLVLLFHDDPTVNPFGIVILLRQVWVYTGKERVLREEERKMKLREKRSVEKYLQFENWLNVFLFIARVLPAYYLLYFSLFLLFYKQELYFISYQMNK